ncbi:MAG: hypothetical protein FK734_20005 [Asgard group archaeon]|nr:hypothetical protein [Asgard group archaeon]
MSSKNDYKKLLIVGSLLGLLGAIAVAVGIFLSFGIIGASGTDVFGLAAISLIVGIFIICLMTFFGAITPRGITAYDERPGLIALAIFIFAPTSLISQYSTPMFYLLSIGNDVLEAASAGGDFGIYFAIVGLALLLVTFFAYAWIFLWKSRSNDTSPISGEETTDVGFVKVFRVITSLLVIASGVGIILGMSIPAYTYVTPGEEANSLLMSDLFGTLDLTVLGFFVEIGGIIITALLVMFGNFGMKKAPKNELPLLAFITFLTIYPGYTLPTVPTTLWSSPLLSVLSYCHGVMIDTAVRTMSIMGWILLISALVMIGSIFLTLLTYFFNKSAIKSEGPSAALGISEPKKRKKKEKFPTGPPSASGPPVGGLAAQLSGPPSATSGPSFMGTSPSATSGPPAAVASDTPTCPFCGKPLRFINEYQRWYCDSCAQYV